MTLLERVWKYTALGASTIMFEEANPILGGIAARHGRLGMVGVVVACALGTWVASVVLYYVGFWRIDWVRRRFPKKKQLLDGALEVVQRHPWRASLAVRFAFGLRLPLPVACGAARVPVGLYILASGISCWVWSLAFAYLGLAFGRAALRVFLFTHRLDVRLGAIGALLGVVLFFVTRRRLIAERTAVVLTGEHIPMMTSAEREVHPTFLPHRTDKR
ncbi:MAG: associated protein [Gemmatimonadetes bacterium]|nr:associated protein [Gemmatimonadota bacterium]